MINAIFPDTIICTEESENGFNLQSNNVWMLNPINNTKSFSYGLPVWGTSISLIKNGNYIFGAIDHPCLNERLISIGNNTYYKNCYETILLPKIITSKNINQCAIATSSLPTMTNNEKEMFLSLSNEVQHVIYNYDCYAYTLLMKGYIDIVIDCGLKPYDFLPLVPMLKSLGFNISDWEGNEVCYSDKVIVTRSCKVSDIFPRIFIFATKVTPVIIYNDLLTG